MANKKNGMFYTRATSNLVKRVYEHKNEIIKGFTQKYGCKYLVFFEFHGDMEAAISREKSSKDGTKKESLS